MLFLASQMPRNFLYIALPLLFFSKSMTKHMLLTNSVLVICTQVANSRTLLFGYALQLSQQWLENEYAFKYENKKHSFPLKSKQLFRSSGAQKWQKVQRLSKKMLLRSHLSSLNSTSEDYDLKKSTWK